MSKIILYLYQRVRIKDGLLFSDETVNNVGRIQQHILLKFKDEVVLCLATSGNV